ncbi:conserved hypothetical protein [Klebsiella variicola]|nr:conserved hypothetical protein [Klebsiella variicola]
MVHCFGLCDGDKPFIACCAEAVARLDYQSSPDAQMAFRLMRYAIAAMQRHLDGVIQNYRWWMSR